MKKADMWLSMELATRTGSKELAEDYASMFEEARHLLPKDSKWWGVKLVEKGTNP